MNRFLQIRRSVIAFLVALALGLLSMGALGAALYYAAWPVLAPAFGDLNDWRGDRVWPATILAGMAWSASFLAAGLAGLKLERRGVGSVPRRIAYGAILWLGAVVAWWAALALTGMP